MPPIDLAIEAFKFFGIFGVGVITFFWGTDLEDEQLKKLVMGIGVVFVIIGAVVWLYLYLEYGIRPFFL